MSEILLKLGTVIEDYFLGLGYQDSHTSFNFCDIVPENLSVIATISNQLVAGSIKVIACSTVVLPLVGLLCMGQ